MTAVATLEDARAVLFDALNVAGVTSLESVTDVFDHDPLFSTIQPPAIVTIFATGKDPDFYLFQVRIYFGTDSERPQDAQKSIGDIIEAVDDALGADGRIGPSEWTISDGVGRLLAQSDVTIGREDF